MCEMQTDKCYGVMKALFTWTLHLRNNKSPPHFQDQRVETFVVGDIVAAPYHDHGTWNRARVLGMLGSGMVDLYYVDFGDNGELPRDSLCRVR